MIIPKIPELQVQSWPVRMRDDPLLKHIPPRLATIISGRKIGVRPTDFLWLIKPGDWFVYIEQGKIAEAVDYLRGQGYRFRVQYISAFDAEKEHYVGQIFVIRRRHYKAAVVLKLAFG